MQVTDEQLERLGEYFVYHRIGERYGITFEKFVVRYLCGQWEAWLAA